MAVASYMTSPQVKKPTGVVSMKGKPGGIGGPSVSRLQQGQQRPAVMGNNGGFAGPTGGIPATPPQRPGSIAPPQAPRGSGPFQYDPSQDPMAQRQQRPQSAPGGFQYDPSRDPRAQQSQRPQGQAGGFQYDPYQDPVVQQQRRQSQSSGGGFGGLRYDPSQDPMAQQSQRQRVGTTAQEEYDRRNGNQSFGGIVGPGTGPVSTARGSSGFVYPQGQQNNQPPPMWGTPSGNGGGAGSQQMSFGGGGNQQMAAGGNDQWNPNDYGGQRQNTNTGGGGGSPSGWNPNVNPYTFTPSTYTPANGLNPRTNAGDIWDPKNYATHDANIPNYLERVLPLEQLRQGAYQYGNDFGEAQRRWNAEHGLATNQNSYQQGLSTRQQQMAEAAQKAANQQWAAQFGQQQRTDQWGNEIAHKGLDIQKQRNQFDYGVGMDQNQMGRDVANTYAGAQRYDSASDLQGVQYSADQTLRGQQYQANQQLKGSNYSADQYSGAQRYGADQQLAGERYSADQYSGAQRYGSDQQRIAQMYGADQGLAEAGLYSGAQRYGTDAQERMNTALMANNLATANIGVYGRSQAPKPNWAARSWG